MAGALTWNFILLNPSPSNSAPRIAFIALKEPGKKLGNFNYLCEPWLGEIQCFSNLSKVCREFDRPPGESF